MVLILLACGTPCEERTGLERDTCVAEAVAATADPAEALALARTLEDRVVLHATVLSWVEAHRDADRAGLVELCGLLDGDHRVICSRRVDAAHLQ